MDGYILVGVMNFFTWGDTVSVTLFSAACTSRLKEKEELGCFCSVKGWSWVVQLVKDTKFLLHQTLLFFMPHRAVILWASLKSLSCLERKLAMDVILPAVSLTQSKPAQQALPSGILCFYCLGCNQMLITCFDTARFNTWIKLIHLLRWYSPCKCLHGCYFKHHITFMYAATQVLIIVSVTMSNLSSLKSVSTSNNSNFTTSTLELNKLQNGIGHGPLLSFLFTCLRLGEQNQNRPKTPQRQFFWQHSRCSQ